MRAAQTLRSTALAALTGLGLWSGNALAHPHEWVEMKIKVLFDDEGKATALNYNWLFDEFFTAYAFSEYEDGKATQEQIDALHAEILGNISEANYLTLFQRGGKELGGSELLGAAKPEKAGLRDIRLELNFTIAFKEPLDLKDAPLKYAIFDPTFYVAMHHSQEDDAVTKINAPQSCSATIDPADPDPDMATFASRLGQEESAGDGLGIHFAEWVEVKC